MKKLFILLAVSVLFLYPAFCPAEGSEEPADASAESFNPIAEYGSLEEINELVGVRLIRPDVTGISNENFSVIGGTIAQYICDIDGQEWTFRGAHITDEDISGIFNENNEFAPEQDFALYTGEVFLNRFFDGDRQYTVTVTDPIGDDGKSDLNAETFADICLELELIQKHHTDDPTVGDYRNPDRPEIFAVIERHGDVYNIVINRILSATEMLSWTVYDAVRDGDRLTYQGEETGRYTYSTEGDLISSEESAVNGVGFFELKDGALLWTGAVGEECREWVFEKTVYTE